MPHADQGPQVRGVTRRSFLQTMGVSAVASSLSEAGRAASETLRQDDELRGPGPVEFKLRVNGQDRALKVEPATTLLEALRLHLGLTGAKEICDRGACGGCTVLVDGLPVNACMMLLADAEGREVTTVEGLAPDGRLDPVQESFVRHDALQCGYCTPGLVVAARALLNWKPKPSLDDIKYALSGNICRCGTYTNVFNAVLEASGQRPIMDPTPEATQKGGGR
jgi:xanthine dehydrogenase YagT iron-sulfur-binding subunit